jgi:uracil-DNA glycosylase
LTAAELFTGNLNNFRGIFNWTSLIGQTTVIAMREPLALLSLTRNPEFFFQNLKDFKKKLKISKISKKLKIFTKFQNFKNFSLQKIS